MNIGVILAGGVGSRMGIIDKPKQFIDVYGKPVIIYVLETFDNHPDIDHIAIVCLKEWVEDIKILIRKYELNKVRWIIEGGATRQESVHNAVENLQQYCSNEDILIIHDSVRPLVSHRIITDNIREATKHGAVDTVISTSDTIVKSVNNTTISEIPKRSELYSGQTPQSFKFYLIKQSHEHAVKNSIENSTDDCQLVLKFGYPVNLVMGEKLNFKITSFDDLLLLKAIIKMGKTEMV